MTIVKIGRNDRCPCGSGKKYKHCCMRKDEERSRSTAGGTTPVGGTTPLDGAMPDDMLDMLLPQTGFATRQELDEALEEYKAHCDRLPSTVQPPSLMEYLGRANPATQVQKEIAGELAGEEFATRRELEERVAGMMRRHSDAPIDDFQGLSPSQMHSILRQSAADNGWLVKLSSDLPDETALYAPLVAVTRWGLQYHADHGGEIRLTARDNYPRAMCGEYLRRFQPGRPSGVVPSETSIFDLYTTHDLMLDLGYTDEQGQYSFLTTDGVGVVSGGDWAGVYRQAFSYLLEEYDWQELFSEEVSHPHFNIIQDSALFLLYLLKKHPEGTVGEFFDQFVQAFPQFVSPAAGDPKVVSWFRHLFVEAFFMCFCLLLGLVEIHPESSMETGEAPYAVTELFHQALQWHQ